MATGSEFGGLLRGREKNALAAGLPVQAPCRGRGVRQPVQRDVVQELVSGEQALGLAVVVVPRQGVSTSHSGAAHVAGYAACFGGALDFVAKQKKKDASKAKVTASVTIGPREAGGFGLAVKLAVEDRSLPQAELAEICPYSNATRNNVDVQLTVVGR